MATPLIREWIAGDLSNSTDAVIPGAQVLKFGLSW